MLVRVTRLTVNGDLDAARVRLGHAVVGDALKLLSLVSFYIRDVQELSLVHAAICKRAQRRQTGGSAVTHWEDVKGAGEPNMLLCRTVNKALQPESNADEMALISSLWLSHTVSPVNVFHQTT